MGAHATGTVHLVAWRWTYDGGESPEFGSQQEAEAWIGAQWRGLLDSGVTAVTLYDGDDLAYEMSLEPA